MTYTPIPAGTANWDVPLNAALADLQAQADAKLPLGGGTLTGALNGVSFNTNGSVRSAFLKTTSSTEHAATIYQAGTSGVDVAAALNVVSDNGQTSAMYLSGTEVNRGTLKIAHRNPGAGATADASAAGLSIDLQYNAQGGTAAQGIFITGTDGPTTGNLLTLRNNSRDDFVVKGGGSVGIRLATGATPAGAVEISQGDISTVGLAMTATSGGQQLVLLKDSAGAARFEVNNTGNSVHRATAFFTSSLQLGATSADLGGATGSVISVKNATAVPTTNPTGGVIIYAEGGFLKARDALGNITNLTKQTVTGSRAGNAALASLLTGLATMGLITDSTTV